MIKYSKRDVVSPFCRTQGYRSYNLLPIVKDTFEAQRPPSMQCQVFQNFRTGVRLYSNRAMNYPARLKYWHPPSTFSVPGSNIEARARHSMSATMGRTAELLQSAGRPSFVFRPSVVHFLSVRKPVFSETVKRT